jgi:hypothetical protein
MQTLSNTRTVPLKLSLCRRFELGVEIELAARLIPKHSRTVLITCRTCPVLTQADSDLGGSNVPRFPLPPYIFKNRAADVGARFPLQHYIFKNRAADFGASDHDPNCYPKICASEGQVKLNGCECIL